MYTLYNKNLPKPDSNPFSILKKNKTAKLEELQKQLLSDPSKMEEIQKMIGEMDPDKLKEMEKMMKDGGMPDFDNMSKEEIQVFLCALLSSYHFPIVFI
jgi:hypothetical protein